MEAKWYFVFLAIGAVAAAIFGSFAYPAYEHGQTDRMKACVSAHMIWKNDSCIRG